MAGSPDTARAVAPSRGFVDVSSDANAVFRTCLRAMSCPGTILPLATDIEPPTPLLPTAAAALLTLADFETQIWLDSPLLSRHQVVQFATFHTGAKVATTPDAADFAVISDVANMPDFDAFATGTPEYPDRSTTLIIQVDALRSSGLVLRGPGIKDEIQLAVAPEPKNFARQLQTNRAMFPRGIDILFVTPAHVVALPRSVHVIAEA
ncbi:MAG: phosphonate C-P lyase system protein PhnH [Pseudomonadota bacterium]